MQIIVPEKETIEIGDTIQVVLNNEIEDARVLNVIRSGLSGAILKFLSRAVKYLSRSKQPDVVVLKLSDGQVIRSNAFSMI